MAPTALVDQPAARRPARPAGARAAGPLSARCHMREKSASMSRAKRAPSNRAPSLCASARSSGAQVGAPWRVARERQRERRVGVGVAADELVEAGRVQQAGGDALREGRTLQRHHRHADPERLAGGGVRVAGPGVEVEVGAGQAAQVLLQRQQGRECQPLGADAARRGRGGQRVADVGVPLQQPEHRIGQPLQQVAPAVRRPRPEILYDWWKAQSSNAPSATPQSARVDGSGRARCRSLGW